LLSDFSGVNFIFKGETYKKKIVLSASATSEHSRNKKL